MARRLLTSTELSLNAIAERTGFRTAHYMSAVFQRELGSPPDDSGNRADQFELQLIRCTILGPNGGPKSLKWRDIICSLLQIIELIWYPSTARITSVIFHGRAVSRSIALEAIPTLQWTIEGCV